LITHTLLRHDRERPRLLARTPTEAEDTKSWLISM
jgi:hypothetical protein